MEKSITVLPEEEEQRLDRVLARLVPDMGLRGRRRHNCYSLGDAVRIKVAAANIDKRQLDFTLVKGK